MFARVITARAASGDLDAVVRLAEQQLPAAQALPGFCGYELLTAPDSGKVIIISLWQTREQMDAVTAGSGQSGVRYHGVEATGLTDLTLDTYEVPVRA